MANLLRLVLALIACAAARGTAAPPLLLPPPTGPKDKPKGPALPAAWNHAARRKLRPQRPRRPQRALPDANLQKVPRSAKQPKIG